MNEFKENLTNTLRENRKNLSDNSIKTYISSLISINKKLDGDKEIKWYDDNAKKIIEYLDHGNKKTSKTILSAIYILNSNKEIHDKMISLSNEVNDQYKLQKKTKNKRIIGCHQIK